MTWKDGEEKEDEREWEGVECSYFMLGLFLVCLKSWWGLYLSVKAEGVKWSSSVWQNQATVKNQLS